MEQILKFVCETHFLENSSVSLKKYETKASSILLVHRKIIFWNDNDDNDDEFIIFQSDLISEIAVLSENKRKASKKNNF